MGIDSALYRIENTHGEVTLLTIEEQHNYDLIKKNLYCAYSSCDARIEYVPKGVYKSYFKTWPKDNHSPDCKDYFEREQKRISEKGSATKNARLSAKHMNDVLNRLYKEVHETEEEKETRLVKQRQKSKNKKSTTTDKSLPPVSTTTMNPTVGIGEETLEGRAPNVRKRHSIHLLSDNDIGFTRGIYGPIESIDILDKRILITLSDRDTRCIVHFEEVFFENAARNISSMFKVLERAINKDKSLEFTGLGIITKDAEGLFNIAINEQNAFKINNQQIAVFAFNN
jgi:hypothetical protein